MDAATCPEPPSFNELVAMLPEALRRDKREDLEDSDYILTQVRVDLRHHFNTFASIDRLPPEIFSCIFEYVVQPSEDRTIKSHKPATERLPEMRALLALSQVSSKWRAIALRTPSLWTHVDTRHEATLEAYLARSRSLPLRVHMIAGMNELVGRLLVQHGHRIRRLDFVEGPPWGHSSASIPSLLECLTVAADCDWLPNEEHDVIQNVCLHSRLKALALQPFCSEVPGISFPFLTHLHLSRFHERALSEDAIFYLTSLLASTPALQFLILSGLQIESIFTSVSPPVVLPSLRALTCLNSDMGAALRFLESLELPEDALVRLDSLHHFASDPPEAQFALPLPSKSLVASFDYLEVVADEKELHVVAQGAHSGLWIRASFIQAHDAPQSSEDQWTTCVVGLGTVLSLASIKTLHICVLDPDLLPTLLPLLPNLVELAVRINPRFTGYDEGPCWSLLDCLYTTLTPESEETVCCPVLQTLAVEVPTEDPDRFRLPDAPERYNKVRTVLEIVAARSSMGKPLRHLAMQPYCDCPAGRVTMMETFRTALAPFEEYVAIVEVVESVKSMLCPLEMRDMWDVAGAEEYWELAPGERPEYRLPWDE
ncbi:hypothetical protein TRAPUB_1136 [Trametes pubescens]|uniref:F-box domain-containing protein n=1 Tax=Trametes pubescens TaxID=154538 RepID=A0A1M2VJZ8_TRAPU|nr:hypothetical protein TRAPUB_1136 [Trametes pubescens]